MLRVVLIAKRWQHVAHGVSRGLRAEYRPEPRSGDSERQTSAVAASPLRKRTTSITRRLAAHTKTRRHKDRIMTTHAPSPRQLRVFVALCAIILSHLLSSAADPLAASKAQLDLPEARADSEAHEIVAMGLLTVTEPRSRAESRLRVIRLTTRSGATGYGDYLDFSRPAENEEEHWHVW